MCSSKISQDSEKVNGHRNSFCCLPVYCFLFSSSKICNDDSKYYRGERQRVKLSVWLLGNCIKQFCLLDFKESWDAWCWFSFHTEMVMRGQAKEVKDKE